MPTDLIVLYPSNTFIIPLDADPERCWWKGFAHLQDGKLYALEGEGIEDLAEALQVPLSSLHTDPDGQKGIPLKLVGTVPILRSLIENSRKIEGQPIQSLWAKNQDNMLHLAAFLLDSERPIFSSHKGDCDIIWKIDRQEV